MLNNKKENHNSELSFDSFFQNETIKELRKMAGGDIYTSIYLKMQLMSINSDGIIYFEGIENTLEKELALKLDEQVDNVEATLMLLQGYDLLKKISSREFLLTRVSQLNQLKNVDTEKCYYLKLKDNFFNSNGMVALESIPDGYKYSNILLKLYLASLKHGGKLILNNANSFDLQVFANATKHNTEDIEKAIKLFQELNLIDVVNDELRLPHELFSLEEEAQNESK